MEYFMYAQPVIFLAIVWGYCKIWGFKPNSGQ
jgi:hypothetical protein